MHDMSLKWFASVCARYTNVTQ